METKYIVFKKHSKSKDKDYYQLAEFVNGKWHTIGFVNVKDMTKGG